MLLRTSFAHLSARIATLAAGLVAIPLVTTVLGTEALGLVGVYTMLQGVLGLFDLGLPVATNRQLALLVSRKGSGEEKSTFIRSVEVLFWIMAGIFLVAGMIAAPFAPHWFQVKTLPLQTVSACWLMIVTAVAFRFPVAFYSNVLFGQSRHTYPNAILVVIAIVRTAAAFVALLALNIGLVGFFIIQLAGNLAEVVLLAYGVWRENGHWRIAPRFDEIRRLARTSSILTLVSLVGVALAQVDKIIVSKVAPLADFGMYAAGFTLASGLLALSYPIGNALFPQLSGDIDHGRHDATAKLVRLGSELTILFVVPLGAVIAMQPQAALDIIFLVRPFPDKLASILPLMMLGGLAHAFATLPHMFQIAAGRPGSVFWANAVFLVPYAILVYMLTVDYGIWGAALVFAGLNGLRLLVYWALPITESNSARAWRGVAPKVIAATASALAVAWLGSLFGTTPAVHILIAVITCIVLEAAMALCLPASRRNLLTTFNS